MKLGTLSILSLSAVVSSELVVAPIQRGSRGFGSRGFAGPQIPPGLKLDTNQRPLVDSSSLPFGPISVGDPSSVMLSDVMGRDRSINIFAGFTRDTETVARRLEDATQNSVVLAPLNSAIEALPRKPWEDPEQYNELGANAYEGEEGYERAQRNLRRFVEAHIIPRNPWPAGEKVKPIGAGREVWWEDRDGTKVVCVEYLPRLYPPLGNGNRC
jgi:paired amphipathic helix protein Sin3a